MNRILVSRKNLPTVIAKAFDLSQPQGMGYLHYQPGPIPADTLRRILDNSDNATMPYLRGVSLDYVEGRAVKLHIPYSEEDSTHYLEERPHWYDHSDRAWRELVEFAKGLS